MSVPLHPAIVHIPVALAVLIPLGAIVVTALAWRRAPSRALVTTLVVAQALLVGSGFIAMRAGEADEERVERVVPEQALEGHEERAETFIVAGAVVLASLAAAWLLARRPGPGRAALTLATAGTLAVAALGFVTGSSGGELVYAHGAARAFTPGGGAPASPMSDVLGGAERDDD